MSAVPAIFVSDVTHRYGERIALDSVSLEVNSQEIFGLLGPNGSGKTTLFRLLSTLLPIQSGSATIADCDVARNPRAVRQAIGITFQSPSLDDRLTVFENLKHQAHLYGLAGNTARSRINELLDQVGLSDRHSEIVAKLSGGMKRRVEIAKGLLHSPTVLLLDEPSTGLDPGARHDLWKYLNQLRQSREVTILVTTHLMEEAERCDRLAILSSGKVVVVDKPAALRNSIGGDCITIDATSPEQLAERIRAEFSLDVQLVGNQIRIERDQGHELLRDLVASFPQEIESISLGKPTLEDVFIQKTGHRFWEGGEA